MLSYDDLEATERAALTHHSSISHATDTVDDSADEYQPDDYEEEHDHEDAMMIDAPESTHIGAPHTIAHMDREAKQYRSDEQVGFIILTRDNNKPDAYGTVSETHGPLPWPGVAKAYNEKYKLCVGPAAMEKRARQHRGAWMFIRRRAKTSQGRRVDGLVVKPGESQTPAEPFEGHIFNHRVGDYMLDSDDEEDCKMNVGGWVPPDIVRNQVADLSSYLDQLRSAQIGNFVIEVFDAQNVSLGTIVADREDLVSSPLLQRLMNGNGRTQVQLHCCATTVVQSYVRCTSSKGLVELPAHLLRDSSLLMNLYCFATQLEDDSVRELILALWHRFAESNTEVSLGLEDLNLLFECTCSGDPAREF
ncbi:hypothetical protein J4E82_000971 [Alternaria postmessia]|uniref:uncharacterized protein n=1 Tax=Alternaria postmessia TaxID=1187938 RepID=UPI002224D007|nr:uncharacterized protein J4E82_000971 [Alternaria postmessia]KAI5380394.1 hypothetical protein J4E82_000971 [Alternaria postmessia]